MWADKDTGIDYINYTETAEIAAEIIRNKSMHPLSLGVFGGWGAGKSSMLHLIRNEIEKSSSAQNDCIIIEFDAWLFQNYDDARASLMEVIARKLIQQAKKETKGLDKAKGLLKRVNYLRAIGTAAEIGASLAFGIPPMGFLKRGIDAVGNFLSSDPSTEDPIEDVKKVFGEGKDLVAGMLKPEDNTPPQQILEFRSHFADVLEEMDKTLVVFIDNLDRCLPDVAIETLEAIRLFLFLDGTVFIIAADEDMIRNSVQKHYGGINNQHVTDYLDKLIQVPLKVPLLGIREVQAYITLLLISADKNCPDCLDDIRSFLNKKLMNSWIDDRICSNDIASKFNITSSSLKSSINLAERLAPILTSAPNISGNPRTIKRLLNTIRIRCRLAEKRGMPVDEALLTKLAVFERCTTIAGYDYLARTILNDEKGQPKLFAELEALTDKIADFHNKLPDEWKESKDFVLKWIKLEPSISDRDLRPAIYLSKESSRLTSFGNNLSKQGKELFDSLMTIVRARSKTASDLAKQCSEEVQTSVMRQLIQELRKATSWDLAPPGFYGAVVLANINLNLGEQLILFLNELPNNTVGSWALPLIEKASWGKEAADTWKNSKISPIKLWLKQQ